MSLLLVVFLGNVEKSPHKLTVGYLIVHGCGADEKKCMIVDMYKVGKMDVLALSETKVKVEGERKWEDERVIVSGVPDRHRAQSTKCVSLRMFWVKLKVSSEKIVIVGVYGPGMEKSENESNAFWECFNECINGLSENERIEVLDDMIAKVGNGEAFKVVRKYGVPGVNENGVRLVEVCSEMRLSIENTWFQMRLIQKYTKEGENRQERSLIDYVLVNEKSKNLVEDVNAYRGAAGDMSDHYLVEAKDKMKVFWKKKR